MASSKFERGGRALDVCPTNESNEKIAGGDGSAQTFAQLADLDTPVAVIPDLGGKNRSKLRMFQQAVNKRLVVRRITEEDIQRPGKYWLGVGLLHYRPLL
jgi:hypothetical protein